MMVTTKHIGMPIISVRNLVFLITGPFFHNEQLQIGNESILYRILLDFFLQ